MKATFTLHNLSDSCYAELEEKNAREKFRFLSELSGTLSHCVKRKIGNGSFKDAVDFNSDFKTNKSLYLRLSRAKATNSQPLLSLLNTMQDNFLLICHILKYINQNKIEQCILNNVAACIELRNYNRAAQRLWGSYPPKGITVTDKWEYIPNVSP